MARIFWLNACSQNGIHKPNAPYLVTPSLPPPHHFSPNSNLSQLLSAKANKLFAVTVVVVAATKTTNIHDYNNNLADCLAGLVDKG